jgi:type I restriction enzyme, S subunit
MASRSGSVDPSKYADEVFDLYSIPAFDGGEPEVLPGKKIGSAKQIVSPGDVLLSRIVPHIRRSWVVGRNRGRRIIASGEWIVFRGEKVHPGYLRHVLVGDRFHAEFMSTVSGVGGSLLRARPEHVAKIRIPLPPLPEQQRIEEVLDRAEALLAKRRLALAQLATLTQAVFLETFVEHTRFPSEALASICDLITDGTHYTPTYSDTGVIFLSSRNVTSGYVDWNDVMFIPESLHTELHRRVAPRKNDILLAKNGTTGVAAIVDRDCVFDIYVSLALLRPSARVLPSFLREAINSPACTRQFKASLKGIGVPNLHLKEIRKTTIPVPPIDLQREFARRVAAVEELKGAHRTSLAELDALFAALQHRAFRGEL